MFPNSFIPPNAWQGQWTTENVCKTFLKWFKIHTSLTQITQNFGYPAPMMYLKDEILFKPAVVASISVCNDYCHSVIRKYFNNQDKTLFLKTTEIYRTAVHATWELVSDAAAGSS